MRRRRAVLGTAGLLALFLFLTRSFLRDAILSGLLLYQVTIPLQPGPLTRITGAPVRVDVSFAGGGREMVGTLYGERSNGARVGILLVHGVNETGKDDARIMWLADLLARAGFPVLTPDFLGFKSLTLRTSDVEELVSSIQYLAASVGGEVGLIGFSYGAGPTLIAAADPRVRHLVRFVVSFGGYYDLLDVITFVTTGWYGFGDVRGRVAPNPYARWIFLRYNLELISSDQDREVLQRIADMKAKNPEEDVDALAASLGPAGRPVYDLLVNRDPARVPALVERLDPRIQAQIRFLSPSRVLPDLRARLFIIQSVPDDFMPMTESLRLADALKARGRVHLTLLSVFHHVQPSFPPLSFGSALKVYIPEGGKMFGVIYRILRERH